MRSDLLKFAASVCVIVWASGVAHGEQPTFGRPKTDRTRSVGSNPADAQVSEEARAPDPIPEWREGDPERLPPMDPQARPGAVYAWKTATGLRYVWSLPFDYQPGEARTMVVLLHPGGLDFRWGLGSHPRGPAEPDVSDPALRDGGFRPHDLVIAIDGPYVEARRGGRWFELSPTANLRFRDAMLEISRQFPVGRISIVGRGGIDPRAMEAAEADAAPGQRPANQPEPPILCGGGAFATAFAAAFPALCDGLVVQAGECAPRGAVNSSVPIVFLHGAKDPSLPLARAISARAAYAGAGHALVRLRTMRSFNDFPNPVRVSECLDYIDGVRTDNPKTAIAAAQRMLTPKRPDLFGYTCPVWYAGAYEVLRRIAGDPTEGVRPLEEVAEARRSDARAWMTQVEEAATTHIEAIGALLNAGSLREVALDGGPWLGYLVAFREDFRGVPACERFAATLGFDEMAEAHSVRAVEMLQAWEARTASADSYRNITEGLTSCYLYEGWPVDLVPFLRACVRKGDELGLAPDEADRFEYAVLWERAWRDGLSRYEQVWRRWPGPTPRPSEDEAAGAP